MSKEGLSEHSNTFRNQLIDSAQNKYIKERLKAGNATYSSTSAPILDILREAGFIKGIRPSMDYLIETNEKPMSHISNELRAAELLIIGGVEFALTVAGLTSFVWVGKSNTWGDDWKKAQPSDEDRIF